MIALAFVAPRVAVFGYLVIAIVGLLLMRGDARRHAQRHAANAATSGTKSRRCRLPAAVTRPQTR
jgi:hypothetical protein